MRGRKEGQGQRRRNDHRSRGQSGTLPRRKADWSPAWGRLVFLLSWGLQKEHGPMIITILAQRDEL
jgi:hypothetical protein